MTRNKLSDLHNILFAQLERLDDEELTAEQLSAEIERSKAMTIVAGKIIDNGKLALEAQHFIAETNGRKSVNLEMLNG